MCQRWTQIADHHSNPLLYVGGVGDGRAILCLAYDKRTHAEVIGLTSLVVVDCNTRTVYCHFIWIQSEQLWKPTNIIIMLTISYATISYTIFSRYAIFLFCVCHISIKYLCINDKSTFVPIFTIWVYVLLKRSQIWVACIQMCLYNMRVYVH